MLQVRVVQALGPNYLGVFSPCEAAVGVASCAAAAQPAFTGRGACTPRSPPRLRPSRTTAAVSSTSRRVVRFFLFKKIVFQFPGVNFSARGSRSPLASTPSPPCLVRWGWATTVLAALWVAHCSAASILKVGPNNVAFVRTRTRYRTGNTHCSNI